MAHWADDLAFVVNPRSGGRAGMALFHSLRDRVSQDRLIDVRRLSGGDRWLQDLLSSWPAAAAGRARIVACGGDGTVSRLADQTRLVSRRLSQPAPPIGVLPLGTGNDLGLALGWNPERVQPSHLSSLITDLLAAQVVEIDRWKIRGPNGFRLSCFNYVSWGMDARIARAFDKLRGRHPEWFASRMGNKAWYAALALTDSSRQAPLSVQGKSLPHWTKSLVFANIHSYAGGGRLAADIQADDGLLDGFCLPGGFLLGLGTRGIRRPYRLGSRRRWTITIDKLVAMQADGEPAMAEAGRYVVKLGSAVPLLLGPEYRVNAASSSFSVSHSATGSPIQGE